jgi:hypothetical protein
MNGDFRIVPVLILNFRNDFPARDFICIWFLMASLIWDSATLVVVLASACLYTSMFKYDQMEPVLRIRDPVHFLPLHPGWLKSQDPGSGFGMNNLDHIS